MRRLALLLSGLSLLACATPQVSGSELGPADEWLPLLDGETWVWQIHAGDLRRSTVRYRVQGSDVRALPDEELVPCQFVLGTPADLEEASEKCLFALTSTGPRELFLDTDFWSLEFDPPLPVLPAAVAVGARWTWRGHVRVSGEPARASRARLRIDALEDITVPAGRFRCVRVVQTHDDGLVCRRWYAQGVGLVRLEFEVGDDRGGLALWEL